MDVLVLDSGYVLFVTVETYSALVVSKIDVPVLEDWKTVLSYILVETSDTTVEDTSVVEFSVVPLVEETIVPDGDLR
jgi:hypothetical protein